jgi:hypothetical protein
VVAWPKRQRDLQERPSSRTRCSRGPISSCRGIRGKRSTVDLSGRSGANVTVQRKTVDVEQMHRPSFPRVLNTRSAHLQPPLPTESTSLEFVPVLGPLDPPNVLRATSHGDGVPLRRWAETGPFRCSRNRRRRPRFVLSPVGVGSGKKARKQRNSAFSRNLLGLGQVGNRPPSKGGVLWQRR